MLKIETLPHDAYHELLQFEEFRQNGLPSPFSIVIVARHEETDEIKGFWVSQMVVHTEPVYIAPDVRNGLVGVQMLAKLMTELHMLGIVNHYCFAPNQYIGQYLERLGMEKLPWSVYFGTIPTPKE